MIPAPVTVWVLMVHLAKGATLVYTEHPFTSEADCREKSKAWNTVVLVDAHRPTDLAFCKPTRSFK